MEVSQYLSMFIDESKEHLQELNENLLRLESNPREIGVVHNIFRSAHTLKGMAATMGYEDIASLTHEMENVLDLVRNSKLEMNQNIFDYIFKSIDVLESMVEDIIQGGTGKSDVTQIVAALRAVVTNDYNRPHFSKTTLKESAKSIDMDNFQYSILQQSINSGLTVFYVEVHVQEQCLLKAARAYMVFDVLENNGDVIKSTPSLIEIEQEKFDRKLSLYYISKVDQNTLEKDILNVSEIDSVVIIKIDNQLFSQLPHPKTGNQVAEKENFDFKNSTITSSVYQEKKALKTEVFLGKTPLTGPGGSPVGNRTIRVDIERLDALMNLFSEMLIDRVRLEQLASEVGRSDLTETVEHMSKVSIDLQNVVLKLRMVPVESVFNRFPRMIRDLAKSLDKKVDLVISGADTELDRNVIDEIGDPLVHLLRNAVDHGVESVSERIATNKSEHGTIQLRAYHSGNHVFIEIEEDGRGISREKVLSTALKNGVVTQELAPRLSDEEVYDLLFESGFSTAEKITDVSGRGVGLDVVKTKVQSLGGHVRVDSKPGIGSKFSVQLPLTLSIISAMLIRLGNEKYAIPLSSIVETATIERSCIRNIHDNRFFDYRSSVIPIVSLNDVFNVPVYHDEMDEANIIVIRKGDKQIALIVDEFIGQQEIVLKPLGKYLSNTSTISGATILGDGQVALILDPNAFIKFA